MSRAIKISPFRPEPELIRAALEVLKMGGVIAFPTETFYGLGADGTSANAVKRVFAAKRRPNNKPLLVLIKDASQLEDVAADAPTLAYELAREFWPGPLTLVVEASGGLPPELTGFTGKIGVRVDGHPVARALVERFERPLTATSANLSGHTPAITSEGVMEQLGGSLDLVLDCGRTEGGATSTVLDLTSSPPEILREGRVPGKFLARFLSSA